MPLMYSFRKARTDIKIFYDKWLNLNLFITQIYYKASEGLEYSESSLLIYFYKVFLTFIISKLWLVHSSKKSINVPLDFHKINKSHTF